MRIKGFIVPLVLFILWNCLDRIDEENGCPQSGAALISVVLLVIPLGWPVFLLRSSSVYPRMMRQFEADVSKWGVALMQPPDSTATVGDNKGGVVPLKPDYADNKAWIAAPQLGFNPSCNVPLPATRPGIYAHTTPVPEAAIPAALDLEEAAADVFFLTPTSKYFQAGEKGWNADAYDPVVLYMMHDAFVPHFGTIFNAAGAVWTPVYRQLVGVVYFSENDDARKAAIDVAYSDVRSAFLHFLKHRGGNGSSSGKVSHKRPIILAGHSQGAEHAARLLLEFFDADTPEAAELRASLAAAYLVGMPMYRSKFKRVAVCETPGDVGCIISWTSF
eukprot:gene22554-3929_t